MIDGWFGDGIGRPYGEATEIYRSHAVRRSPPNRTSIDSARVWPMEIESFCCGRPLGTWRFALAGVASYCPRIVACRACLGYSA